MTSLSPGIFMSRTDASAFPSSHRDHSSDDEDLTFATKAPPEGIPIFQRMERNTALAIKASGQLPSLLTAFRVGDVPLPMQDGDGTALSFRWFGDVSNEAESKQTRKFDVLYLEHRDGAPTGYATLRAVTPGKLFTGTLHISRLEVSRLSFVQGMILNTGVVKPAGSVTLPLYGRSDRERR
jgi:hypothetical protein